MKHKRCYYCNKEFGMNEVSFKIRRAFNPPYTPHRFAQIGSCCEGCESIGRKTTIDYWRDMQNEPTTNRVTL